MCIHGDADFVFRCSTWFLSWVHQISKMIWFELPIVVQLFVPSETHTRHRLIITFPSLLNVTLIAFITFYYYATQFHENEHTHIVTQRISIFLIFPHHALLFIYKNILLDITTSIDVRSWNVVTSHHHCHYIISHLLTP